MSEDKVGGVDLNQYQKEKEEFAETLDNLFSEDNVDKTDEELNAELNKKTESKSDEGGEPKEDPKDSKTSDSQQADPSLFGIDPEDDPSKEDGKDKDTDDSTDPDTTDWKKKAEELEAELAKEKQKTSSWNGRIKAANQKADDLQKEVDRLTQELEKATSSSSDEGGREKDDPKLALSQFKEDFPEISGVVDIMMKEIDNLKSKQAKDLEPDPDPAPADNDQGTQADPDLAEAQAEIRKAHPDLDEAVNSGVLLTWINNQPDFIRPTLLNIYQSGTPEQVITMVTEFKNKSGWKSALATNETDTAQQDKLNSMAEVNSESGGAPPGEPDKNDYDGAAKEAFAS